MRRVKVAFICVHNSCRSQMAEALGKLLANDVFDSYSAGTKLKDRINPDAISVMKKLYDLDMEKAQYPKLISSLPPVDVVITMGCGVDCPFLNCKYREDWGLEDPTSKGEAAFRETVKVIEAKIIDLRRRISSGELPLDSNTYQC
mgnify:CR=1 FL=1